MHTDRIEQYRYYETPEAPGERYLFVRSPRDGFSWIVPLEEGSSLNERELIQEFLDNVPRFKGTEIEPPLTDRPVEGKYRYTLYLDGQEPNGATCWTNGGFYIRRREPVESI
jgi:hypothetical protein